MRDADALIAALAREVRPVRRLRPPGWRLLAWLAGSAWLAAFLFQFADPPALMHRLTATPDMGVAFLGAVGTAAAAALAAFQTSVPGRPARWALLPIPALVIWIGASGIGCLRTEAAAFTRPEGAMHPIGCIYFIVLVSAPLAALIAWQVMRACPLRPVLTASLSGLASAAAAASLLTLVHPFDAAATDLLAHAAAVLAVVGGVLLLRPRLHTHRSL